MTYQDILHFWFEEIEESSWWIKNSDFDHLLREKFATIHTQAKQCVLFTWRSCAQGRLAEIIILDQFSRNIFRDTAQAFACDSLALALAQEAIALGADKVLNAQQKSVLYLPYMHSESLAIHDVAIELYKENGLENNLDFEIKHRDIIARFGRYPHRNAILKRESTAEELQFLTQAGSSF